MPELSHEAPCRHTAFHGSREEGGEGRGEGRKEGRVGRCGRREERERIGRRWERREVWQEGEKC